jgi:hypothetical protein
MGTGWEKLKAEHDRHHRFRVICSVVGSVIASSILLAAKVIWGLPDHDWWRIAFGPVVAFGFFVGVMWFASWSDLRDARRREFE